MAEPTDPPQPGLAALASGVLAHGDDPALYQDLLRIARAELSRHRRGETLDTRGLVHEAYFKLAAAAGGRYANRTHFFATAARAMRQVVIDYARSRLRDCRGAGAGH